MPPSPRPPRPAFPAQPVDGGVFFLRPPFAASGFRPPLPAEAAPASRRPAAAAPADGVFEERDGVPFIRREIFESAPADIPLDAGFKSLVDSLL